MILDNLKLLCRLKKFSYFTYLIIEMFINAIQTSFSYFAVMLTNNEHHVKYIFLLCELYIKKKKEKSFVLRYLVTKNVIILVSFPIIKKIHLLSEHFWEKLSPTVITVQIFITFIFCDF